MPGDLAGLFLRGRECHNRRMEAMEPGRPSSIAKALALYLALVEKWREDQERFWKIEEILLAAQGILRSRHMVLDDPFLSPREGRRLLRDLSASFGAIQAKRAPGRLSPIQEGLSVPSLREGGAPCAEPPHDPERGRDGASEEDIACLHEHAGEGRPFDGCGYAIWHPRLPGSL